jgi:hypothetical protein
MDKLLFLCIGKIKVSAVNMFKVCGAFFKNIIWFMLEAASISDELNHRHKTI